MAIVINGSGTVTGLAVGGLPDGTVDSGTLATDSVTAAKLEASAITVGDLPAGSVLQVVQGTLATISTSTSTTYIDTGLTATITPTSSSSKILATVSAPARINHTAINSALRLQLLRGASVISIFANYVGWNSESSGYTQETSSISLLDSPASTSALIYKVQFRSETTNNVSVCHDSSVASITLMEIAG